MGKIKYKPNARKRIHRWEYMLLNGTMAYDRNNQSVLHIVEDVFNMMIASTWNTELKYGKEYSKIPMQYFDSTVL